MKHFYKIVLAVALLSGPTMVQADSGKLVLSMLDGETSINVSSISQITFDGTQMIISTSDGGTRQLNALDLNHIKFDMSTLAAESISKEFEDGVSVRIEGAVIYVSAAANSPVNVSVYSIKGACVSSISAQGMASVDLNPLAPGVYIIKANNKTIKFTR